MRVEPSWSSSLITYFRNQSLWILTSSRASCFLSMVIDEPCSLPRISENAQFTEIYLPNPLCWWADIRLVAIFSFMVSSKIRCNVIVVIRKGIDECLKGSNQYWISQKFNPWPTFRKYEKKGTEMLGGLYNCQRSSILVSTTRAEMCCDKAETNWSTSCCTSLNSTWYSEGSKISFTLNFWWEH